MSRHCGCGFVSRKKGARSMGQKKRKKGKIIIIINKEGNINMKKKEEINIKKTYHKCNNNNAFIFPT